MLAEVVLHRMVCRGGVFVTKPGFAPLKKEGCGVPKQAQKHGFQRQNRVRQVQWPVWSETSVQTFEFCSLKGCDGHFVQNKGCSKRRCAKWSLDWPIRLPAWPPTRGYPMSAIISTQREKPGELVQESAADEGCGPAPGRPGPSAGWVSAEAGEEQAASQGSPCRALAGGQVSG